MSMMNRKNGIHRLVAVLLVAVVAGTPVSVVTAYATSYESVLIKDVPHVWQKPNFCGEACVEMMLKVRGHKGDQDWVFNQSDLNPLLGRGCVTRELKNALEAIGFRPGRVWHQVKARQAGAELELLWKDMHADLTKGIPSIVCMHYDDKPKANEHFRLILGYDSDKDQVVYHEPDVEKGSYRRMKRDLFLKLWPLKYKKHIWTVIRFRLSAEKLKEWKVVQTFTPADYAQHMLKLREKVDLKSFHVIIQAPFVVIGDESRGVVEHRGKRTVKWISDHLRKLYFTKDPKDILDIWLFKDKESYLKHTKKFFNDEPDTPFGYFSHAHGALVMNIATGGGTLCHEVVHTFIETNFPACPSWFNEGLASLYEQCTERNGRLLGMTNWRLAGLQKAIRGGTVPTFKELCSTTSQHFYRQDKGTNYAQARYLCYYLQRKDLLVKYYNEFRKNSKADPTGYKTLQKVLGVEDMKKWQEMWEKWILTLHFP